MRLPTLALASLTFLAACTDDMGSEELDGIDDDLVQGKADTGGYTDDSAEAYGILMVANTGDKDELSKDVGLGKMATANIVAFLLGDDGKFATADDVLFHSLRELDAVPYVGPVAFARLATYARKNNYFSPKIDGRFLIAVDTVIGSPLQFVADFHVNVDGSFVRQVVPVGGGASVPITESTSIPWYIYLGVGGFRMGDRQVNRADLYGPIQSKDRICGTVYADIAGAGTLTTRFVAVRIPGPELPPAPTDFSCPR